MKKKKRPIIPKVVLNKSVKKAEVVQSNKNQLLDTTPHQQDALISYLNQIKKYPVLSKEQEQKLAIEYKETKDPKIAEILITSNLRFVVRVALDYVKFGSKMIDLIQEGNIGLIQAVKEFDPYKKTRIITYAIWWIRGYIQEYIMKQYSVVKVGTTKAQKKLFYKLEKETQRLKQLGSTPTVALLSQSLNLPEKDIKIMKQRLQNKDSSLDSFDSDIIENKNLKNPEEQLSLKSELLKLKKDINLLKKDLTKQERYILENRILSEKPMTLKEIGDQFGITKEGIRQAETRVIEKIKNQFIQN